METQKGSLSGPPVLALLGCQQWQFYWAVATGKGPDKNLALWLLLTMTYNVIIKANCQSLSISNLAVKSWADSNMRIFWNVSFLQVHPPGHVISLLGLLCCSQNRYSGNWVFVLTRVRVLASQPNLKGPQSSGCILYFGTVSPLPLLFESCQALTKWVSAELSSGV